MLPFKHPVYGLIDLQVALQLLPGFGREQGAAVFFALAAINKEAAPLRLQVGKRARMLRRAHQRRRDARPARPSGREGKQLE